MKNLNESNFDLLQVSIPGLHISLGIFLRLFNLLENAVHKLDCELAATSITTGSTTSFADHIQASEQLAKLKEDRVRVEQRATVVEQVITLSAVNQSASFSTTPLLVNAMLQEAAKLRQELQTIVSMLTNKTI